MSKQKAECAVDLLVKVLGVMTNGGLEKSMTDLESYMAAHNIPIEDSDDVVVL